MTGARVTYDETANAAYVYLTEPRARVTSARTYPCDPVDVDGVINLDFDDQGRLVGIRCWRPVRNCPSTCSSPRSDWTPTAHDRLSVVGHRISFSKTPRIGTNAMGQGLDRAYKPERSRPLAGHQGKRLSVGRLALPGWGAGARPGFLRARVVAGAGAAVYEQQAPTVWERDVLQAAARVVYVLVAGPMRQSAFRRQLARLSRPFGQAPAHGSLPARRGGDRTVRASGCGG
ncbi:DUF2283 domain-containing protein [Streptomyces sp. B21-105]